MLYELNELRDKPAKWALMGALELRLESHLGSMGSLGGAMGPPRGRARERPRRCSQRTEVVRLGGKGVGGTGEAGKLKPKLDRVRNRSWKP